MVLTSVLGRLDQSHWHDKVQEAEAAGTLELLRVQRADAPRRRMRLVTDRGRDVAISLARDTRLVDGAVLHASPDLTIMVRVDGGPRLRLVPADPASALRLGYFCGNLHWKADFRDAGIEIHMDGKEEAFRARLHDAAAFAEFTIERLEADG